MSATSAPVWLPSASKAGSDRDAANQSPKSESAGTSQGEPMTPRRRTANQPTATEEAETAADAAQAAGPGSAFDPTHDQVQASGQIVATSSVSAEAQQGDGPAAASASSSAVGPTTDTKAVSVVVGPNGASAACPFGVVVVGPQGAAAASEVGVATVGPAGAASASNAANSSRAVIDGKPSGHDGDPQR
jgi:hypothetical protein